MRIISRKMLREFQIRRPRSRQSLDDWHRLVESTIFGSLEHTQSMTKLTQPLAELIRRLRRLCRENGFPRSPSLSCIVRLRRSRDKINHAD
jgi:hypothetical protein